MDIPAECKPHGILLYVRLTPKSSAARIAGVELHAGKFVLKAHVTDPPEDGKANGALSLLIARWLDVPKTTVSIASGQKSRLKCVAVAGNGAELLNKLAVLLTAPSGIPGKKGEGGGYG
jgi:uncharacterized protein